jgi:hypothetical protein
MIRLGSLLESPDRSVANRLRPGKEQPLAWEATVLFEGTEGFMPTSC